MTEDKLEPPSFLRRSARLTREEVKRIIGSPDAPRNWAPIRPLETIRMEEAMAKVGLAVVDRAAPVEVYLHNNFSDGPKKTFAGMDAFEAWYKPSIGRFLGGQTSADINLIMLEEINERSQSGPKAAPVRLSTGSLVTVNGTEYGSVKAAFEALGFPMGKRFAFRKLLKIAGHKTFSHNGQDYQFKTGTK